MLANDQNVVISNNSKHNNYSNHKPLTGLQYDNNQTVIISYHLLLFCNDNNNFYPQSILIREGKLLLETVTYICAAETSNYTTATETVTCIIVMERFTNIPVTESNT